MLKATAKLPPGATIKPLGEKVMTDSAKETQEKLNKEVLSAVEDILKYNVTLQQIKGITDKEMDAIYTAGYSYYNHGKYDNAAKIFSLLCQYNQNDKRYWLGLGAARQMMKRYAEALDAYSFGTMHDIEDPRFAFYGAECCIQLKQFEVAEDALEAVLTITKTSKGYENIRKRAETLMQTVKERLKSQKKAAAPSSKEKKEKKKK